MTDPEGDAPSMPPPYAPGERPFESALPVGTKIWNDGYAAKHGPP